MNQSACVKNRRNKKVELIKSGEEDKEKVEIITNCMDEYEVCLLF